VTGELTLAGEDSVDELFLAGDPRFHLEIATDSLQLVDGHPAQLVDVKIAALAVLEIVVLGDGCAAGGSSARAAIA
jgi:hypothetical protein